MSTGSTDYYVIHYHQNDAGCPVSLAGFFNYSKFEWDPLEPNPIDLKIEKDYELKLSDKEISAHSISFDFYQNGGIYVSREFLRICHHLNIPHKAIPLLIRVNGERIPGEYFIFLPGESISALDYRDSIFEISRDLKSNQEIISPVYSQQKSIDRIDLFHMKDDIDSHLFRCQETLELFCSSLFKSNSEHLKGLAFTKIDENYRYNPWAELEDI